MAAPESEYSDAYGIPHEQRAQWGQIAQQQRENAALKGMNPAASQFINLAPGSAPTQKSVAQRGAQLQRGVATYQPKTPPMQNNPPPPPQREFGQPRTGAGAPPGTPLYGFGQQPKAPLGGKFNRGYGSSSGLVPEDDQFQRSYFGGPNHYFRALAALPNASPEIQWFAKQHMEEEQ